MTFGRYVTSSILGIIQYMYVCPRRQRPFFQYDESRWGKCVPYGRGRGWDTIEMVTLKNATVTATLPNRKKDCFSIKFRLFASGPSLIKSF